MSYLDTFGKLGMQKEVELVIDSLWNIDKDIQQFVYKEPQIFGFDFNYGNDDWRKLLEFTRQYNIKNMVLGGKATKSDNRYT